jgi:hypothetical protein
LTLLLWQIGSSGLGPGGWLTSGDRAGLAEPTDLLPALPKPPELPGLPGWPGPPSGAGPVAPTAPAATPPLPATTPPPAPATAVGAVTRPPQTDQAPPATNPAAPPARWLHVANTGGKGVFLRRSPAMHDRQRAWPERTPMLFIHESVIADGQLWLKVCAPDNVIGWIPAQFLV